jgi:hypothetical protein
MRAGVVLQGLMVPFLLVGAACAGGEGGPADVGDGSQDDVPACTDPDAGLPAAIPLAQPLASARQNLLFLRDWVFATDGEDAGVAQQWFAPGFDDGAWRPIRAGEPWEAQLGFDWDGVGWYRATVDIPADWAGAAVVLEIGGAQDTWDAWINGQPASSCGGDGVSCWLFPPGPGRVDGLLLPGKPNVLAIRVSDWGNGGKGAAEFVFGQGGGLWRKVLLRRHLPLDSWRDLLPAPVLDAHPEWVNLYDESWRMAWDKVGFAWPGSPMQPAYMDEGFSEHIFQWDTCFIALFGRYGMRLFPVMASLDNFYDRQLADGYIGREYSETDGWAYWPGDDDLPGVNPPLFSWVEWAWFEFTGDASRLQRVLPILERQFAWMKAHMRRGGIPGLYGQNGVDSGMDNLPRGDVANQGWIDASAQQVLNARFLQRMAGVLGLTDREAAWGKEADDLAALVNASLWSDVDGFYHDAQRGGGLSMTKHIGAFWTLLAGIATGDRAARLVQHLGVAGEFDRPHRVPTLSADSPGYVPEGGYWHGGVWAPTNTMVVRGLAGIGRRDLAREIAENHLANMATVYAAPPEGQPQSIWECYAPELPRPASIEAARPQTLSRRDFVGWSGLGPIAMLIENVLGFEVDGRANRVTWDLQRTDRHGILRLPVGMRNVVSLVADARATPDAEAVVAVDALRSFELQVLRPGRPPFTATVCGGATRLTVP